MQINDTINALFELGGSIVTWMNFFKLLKDKGVKGVYWATWVFFSSWGIWNIYYYPTLGQYLSFYAGILLASGNIAWLIAAGYFIWSKKK